MVEVGVEWDDLLLGVARLREDAGNHAGVLGAIDGGESLDADVGVEAVIDLGGVFEIVAVADRSVADIAGDEDSLGGVDGDEAGIGVVNGAVGEVGPCEELWNRRWRRDGAGHVEMDRIMADFAALAEVGEFDALYLELGEAVSDEGVASVISGGEREVRVVAGVGCASVLQNWGCAFGLDEDAAGEQGDSGAIFEMARGLGCGAVRVIAWAG